MAGIQPFSGISIMQLLLSTVQAPCFTSASPGACPGAMQADMCPCPCGRTFTEPQSSMSLPMAAIQFFLRTHISGKAASWGSTRLQSHSSSRMRASLATAMPHAAECACEAWKIRESSMGKIVKRAASERPRCGRRRMAALVCRAAQLLALENQCRQIWCDARFGCLQGLQGQCNACRDDAYMHEVLICMNDCRLFPCADCLVCCMLPVLRR